MNIENEEILSEILIVDDGSSDATEHVVRSLQRKDKRIRILSFSRNFGHQAALKAGLDHAKGDCVITMDADLQHPPQIIPKMLALWQKGYDVVYTVRSDGRETSFAKRITSTIFYQIFRISTGLSLEIGAADFRLLDRKVVDALQQYNESVLFLRAIIASIGFAQVAIPYQVGKRFKGTSHYTVKKMLMLAIAGITSFSIRPLYIAVVLGILLSFFSGLYAIYALGMFFFFDRQVLPGWASILVSVLFIGGVQLIMLGVIGVYVGNIYIETKRRPMYIINQS